MSRGSVAVVVAIFAALTTAPGFDETRHPNWKGQWLGSGPNSAWDPTKPAGAGQQAPLMPEAIYDASLTDQAAPALVAGIHVFFARRIEDVDGRDKPGYDGRESRPIGKLV
jgi:hypothetical protein